MFSFQTGLLALSTSQPSMLNKACTPNPNEHFTGVNAVVTKINTLFTLYLLIILLLYFHITVFYIFSLVL